MMSAFASFTDFLLPVLLQLLGLILGGLLFGLSRLARQRWGIEIEASHREALHSALMSGVRAAVARGLSGPAATASAVAYAGRSVPDALGALKPAEGVLASIAEAKLTEVSVSPAPPLAAAPEPQAPEGAVWRPDPRWGEAPASSAAPGGPRWDPAPPPAYGETPRGAFTRPAEGQPGWR